MPINDQQVQEFVANLTSPGSQTLNEEEKAILNSMLLALTAQATMLYQCTRLLRIHNIYDTLANNALDASPLTKLGAALKTPAQNSLTYEEARKSILEFREQIENQNDSVALVKSVVGLALKLAPVLL